MWNGSNNIIDKVGSFTCKVAPIVIKICENISIDLIVIVKTLKSNLSSEKILHSACIFVSYKVNSVK
jgi:hypothetical protein